MSDLSFNKNNFTKSEPAKFSKPIINNNNKFGIRTIEEIKEDMNKLKKPKVDNKPKMVEIKPNNLTVFRKWNNK